MIRYIFIVILSALLLLSPVNSYAIVSIYNNYLHINAGQKYFWKITLDQGEKIFGSFSSNGGVNIYVDDTFNHRWYLINDLSTGKFIFTAPHRGVYYFNIDNTHSIFSDKNIYLFLAKFTNIDLQNFFYTLNQKISNYLDLVKSYNPRLNLPNVNYIVCDSPNAFYSPAINTISICYNLINNIIDFSLQKDSSRWEDIAINGISFVFFHELGHALISLCNLPVLGKEEDAADSLATLAAIEIDPEIAYDGALLFLSILRSPYPIYWDSHSPSEERFYDILCWLYGSDPRKFFLIPEYYPQLRNRNCQYEYYQLDKSWTNLLEKCGFSFEE